MRRAVRRLAALTGIVLVSSAHVGSPDAWYDGMAGPYRVLVHVQAPAVVPGIAVVNVRVMDDGVSEVTAFVNKFDATGGTPPPDVANPVSDNPGWYRTQLWVMSQGSNAVNVTVHGTKGTGSAVVPLTALAGRRLSFNAPLAVLLIAVGIFLALGMFTIVGAAVRESVLPPGAEPDRARRRRARFAMARASLVFLVAMSGTAAWWRADDAEFSRKLFHPLKVETRIDTVSKPPMFVMAITDSAWIRTAGEMRVRGTVQRNGIIEDHGKLLHLFLVSTSGDTAFAHLHPLTDDTVTFRSVLPPLPSGTYRVFADIVHSSGLTETLTSSVNLPGASFEGTGRRAAVEPGDADDSWSLGTIKREGNRATLDDGTVIVWLGSAQALRPNVEADLRFAIVTPPGSSPQLEPYLGMPAHAVVVRDDGQVFIHLHPLGTISMAAQSRLDSTVRAMHNMPMSPQASDTIYFPYAFPQPGNYTIWVQFKRAGRVLTASFPTVVAGVKKD